MIRATNLPQRLAHILATRGRIADFTRDCICTDDADGKPPRLAHWDEAKLGSTPTQVEVDAASDQPVVRTAEQLEEDARQALNGAAGTIDLYKLIKAKVISDEAYRLGKAPGQLTAAELLAIRNRIAAIYKAL